VLHPPLRPHARSVPAPSSITLTQSCLPLTNVTKSDGWVNEQLFNEQSPSPFNEWPHSLNGRSPLSIPWPSNPRKLHGSVNWHLHHPCEVYWSFLGAYPCAGLENLWVFVNLLPVPVKTHACRHGYGFWRVWAQVTLENPRCSLCHSLIITGQDCSLVIEVIVQGNAHLWVFLMRSLGLLYGPFQLKLHKVRDGPIIFEPL